MTRLQWVAMEGLPPLSCPTWALEDPPSQIGGPWFQGIFNCIMEKYERKFLEYHHTRSRGCVTLFENLFAKDTGRLCKFLAELPDGAKLWSLFPSAPGGSSLISVSILCFRHSLYNAQLSPSEDTNLLADSCLEDLLNLQCIVAATEHMTQLTDCSLSACSWSARTETNELPAGLPLNSLCCRFGTSKLD